jgi:DMSO/TMAO reductase YedYZ molybdopterin-dependent catalytic subunit
MRYERWEWEVTIGGECRAAGEQKRMMSYEELAKMPLESLLYDVLVGDGWRSL